MVDERRRVERRTHVQPVATEQRRNDRRGRPKSEHPHSQFLVIRLTASQRTRLRAVASLNGVGLSAFVREAIDEAVLDCADDPIFR